MTLELFIASLALLISVMQLWKTYFYKSKPFFTIGTLTEQIYPIKSASEEWYVCSFHMPISISNHGAQLLIIEKLRLKLVYQDIELKNNYEYLYAKWILDTKDSKKIDSDRFRWINDIDLEDWIPQLIQARSIQSKSFIFETRWDFPIDQKLTVTLQGKLMKSNSWSDISSWDINHNLTVWQMLVMGGSSIDHTTEPKVLRRSKALSNKIYIKNKIEFNPDNSFLIPSYSNKKNALSKILKILNKH